MGAKRLLGNSAIGKDKSRIVIVVKSLQLTLTVLIHFLKKLQGLKRLARNLYGGMK
jgi:hypothetical protein